MYNKKKKEILFLRFKDSTYEKILLSAQKAEICYR